MKPGHFPKAHGGERGTVERDCLLVQKPMGSSLTLCPSAFETVRDKYADLDCSVVSSGIQPGCK